MWSALARRASALVPPPQPARAISFYPSVPRAAKEQKARRGRKALDLGWKELIAPLEGAPLTLPKLKSLRVEHGNQGFGHTGARKFKALLPPLRWQNPDADISLRWLDEESGGGGGGGSRVLLELDDGGSHELDVSGKRSEEILGEILQVAGAPADTIGANVQWAADFLKGRPASSKPHEMTRLSDRSTLDDAAADAESEAAGGAQLEAGFDGGFEAALDAQATR